MHVREELIKQIITTVATWKAEIELRGSARLYDSHIIAEDHVKNLLNLAYGYQLENLNYETKNRAGIDLGDNINSIAFQVTARNDRKKIQDTIRLFVKHHLHKQYQELHFFILGQKTKHRMDFDTGGLFEFDKSKHIIDFRDLIQQIETLETPVLSEIVDYLEQESTSRQIEERSLQISLKYYPETGLGTAFLVRLTNGSQRPMTVIDVFLETESGERIAYRELSKRYIQLSTPLPQTLEETRFSEFLFPLFHMNQLKGDAVTSPLEINTVRILDSLEQEHLFPSAIAEEQKVFAALREEIQKHWEINAWLPR